MDVIPQIMLYVIGTYLTFSDVTRLALTSSTMDKRTKEARKMLAKREVMRLFSSDLDSFRMIIYSVSYELGPQDHSTPTLNDGHDWLGILKEGLSLKQKWPLEYEDQLKNISLILRNPENNLPSFHRNSFSKLETTMQDHLFEQLNSPVPMNSYVEKDCLSKEVEDVSPLAQKYLLYANFYKHDDCLLHSSPSASSLCSFHQCLVTAVKFT